VPGRELFQIVPTAHSSIKAQKMTQFPPKREEQFPEKIVKRFETNAFFEAAAMGRLPPYAAPANLFPQTVCDHLLQYAFSAMGRAQ
jgi:hypothetical protein